MPHWALLESVLRASLQMAAVAMVMCFLHLLHRRYKRISISYTPGPEKSDSSFGNLTDLYFKEASESNFQWEEKYGQVFKIYGLLGEEHLVILDPKAMKHVYANSQSFIRQKHMRNLLKMFLGPALGVVDFDDHKRQRKVMQPAFGSPQLRNLFPVFVRHTQKLVQLLGQEITGNSDRQSLQITIYDYTRRVTLDLTGEAAFEYQFGALDNKQDKLKEVVQNLEAQSLGNNSKFPIFFSFIGEHLPEIIIEMIPYLSTKRYKYIRQTRATVTVIAAEVMTEKQNETRKGLDGGKDIVSLLLRANTEEDKHRRMSDEARDYCRNHASPVFRHSDHSNPASGAGRGIAKG